MDLLVLSFSITSSSRDMILVVLPVQHEKRKQKPETPLINVGTVQNNRPDFKLDDRT